MADRLDQYDPIFQAAGQEWNVDPLALKAIAAQESRGNPGAVSPAGALGVMQLMPETARGLGVTDPTDPAQSIYAGAKYMSQALGAEHESPAAALLYYHGGPGWRQRYGSESAAYVPGVAAHYQQYAKASTGPATDAAPAPAAAGGETSGGAAVAQSDDPFTKALQAPAPAEAPGGGDGKADTPDAFTQALGKPEQGASQAQDNGQTTARGVARNAAAGVLEGSGSAINVLHDPIGNLVLRPLMTMGAAGYDWLAPHVGWPQMTPEQRADLTGDDPQYPQPGSALANAAGASSVTPATPAEAAVRQATAGAVAATALAPGGVVVPSAVGAGGALAGNAAATVVPPQYAPAAQLAGNVLGGAAGGIAAAGAVRGGNALAGAVRDVANAPAPEHPLMPHEPIPTITVTGELPSAPLAGVNPVSPEAAARAAEMPKAPSSPLPPEAQAAAAAAPAEHQQWVAGMPQRVADLVAENAKEGGPSALGAQATPEELAKMSPQQEKAYRRMAELNELLTPARGPDDATHVAGSIPTLAERAADPVVSQREVLAREKDPNSFGPRLEANNQARVNQFDDLSGTAVSKQDLKDQMEALDSKNAARIRSALTGDMDVQPAIAHLSDILDDPVQSERDAIQKVFAPLRKALYDQRTGEPKTDPQSIWGQFKNVQDKLKKAAAGNSTETEVMGELVGYRKQLASMLNDNTRGVFQSALDDHAALAKQFSAQDLLQKKRATLTDKNGMINANSYHRWLIDLAMRRGKPGIDASMDLPDSTMRGLIAIDNDLKRSGNIDLGKARGSPTNLYMTLGRALGIGAAHAATTAVTGHVGIGNMLAQQAVSRGEQQLQQFRLRRIVRQHLAPPPNSLQP